LFALIRVGADTGERGCGALDAKLTAYTGDVSRRRKGTNAILKLSKNGAEILSRPRSETKGEWD